MVLLGSGLTQRTMARISGRGGEVLARAALDVLGVLLEQPFVDFALDVGGHGNPLLLVNHLHNAVQNGGIADLVGGLLEDFSQQPALFAQLFEDRLVFLFQFRALEGVHVRPGVAGGDAGLLVIGWSGILIRHFEEDQVGELLQVVPVGYAVVPQGIAHAPDLGDDG